MTLQEFQFELVNLQDKLMRYASSLTYNNDDAKELVQETFLKALTHRNYYKDDTNMKAWTFTIMKNSFINNYRKIVKENSNLSISGNQFLIENRIDTNSPESQYSHKEISQMVNISEGTSKSNLARARIILQRRVGSYTGIKKKVLNG